MAGVNAGLVMEADVNSQAGSGGGGMAMPANWSTIWFVLAVVYLVGVYYGMININAG